MRRLLAIATLIALGASTPAWADVTLRYRALMPPTPAQQAPANPPTLTVIADDSGQARIEMAAPGPPPGAPAVGRPPSVTFITREGVGYVALSGPQVGMELVARQDDVLAVLTPVASGLASGSVREGVQEMMRQRVEMAPGGPENVAGLPGTLYRVVIVDGETRSPPIEVVLSSDPRLAPARRELVRLIETMQPTFVAVLGGEPQIYTAFQSLLGRGVPLRIGNMMVLDSFNTDDVPDSRFALPGPVMTREQLGQMMDAMMGSGPPAGEGAPAQAPAPPAGTPPPTPQ
jgi:hypothetical protein